MDTQWRTELRARANLNRGSMTESERRIWRRIRRRRLGVSFRAQVVLMDSFIVDFCCFERRLVVEVDGEYHDDPKDSARDHSLRCGGYVVLRVSNHEVERDIESVLRRILDALENTENA